MVDDRWYRPAETVLLTGAGFTKSFGGFLAREMPSAILRQGEVQEDQMLHEEIHDEVNYERFYDSVQRSPKFKPEQKDSLSTAIRRVYMQMENNLGGLNITSSQIAHGACRRFIRRFVGSTRERGFFFTLNHDLFVERFYINHPSGIFVPGLRQLPEWFRGDGCSARWFGDNYQVELPNESTLEQYTKTFCAKGTDQFAYVKLHGSYGWKSQVGSNVIVMGYEKEGSIKDEPLLSWYLSLFKNVLEEHARDLLVIGYGFGDEHINRIIADAIKKRHLRLHIVLPMPFDDLREIFIPVKSSPRMPYDLGEALWKGVAYPYPNKVTDFYIPSDNPKNKTGLTSQGEELFGHIGLL